MEGAASCTPMRVINLLIQVTTGNKEVKGSFEGFLGIVKEGIKAIPAGGPQGARGIHETGEGHWHDFIGCIDERHLIHLILHWVVEILVITNTAAKATDAAQIRFNIRAPLSFGPRGSTHLQADRGIGGEGGGASCRRGI